MNSLNQQGGEALSSKIVTLNAGVPVTTSLVIAKGTDHEHRVVLKLIRENLSDFEDFGRVAFEVQPFETAGGAQSREVAILNEHQAVLAVTFMRNIGVVKEFKKALVKAFFEMAKQLRNPAPSNIEALIPRTLPEALRAYAGALDENESLRARTEVQQATIATLEPKAAFHDKVARASADDAISMREFAKLLGTGQNRLFFWLRSQRICIDTSTEPYQQYVEQGYFKIVEEAFKDKKGRDRVYLKTLVTPRGQVWLQKKWGGAA